MSSVVVDEGGVGEVRLGMSRSDYRAVYRDQSGWDRGLTVATSDAADWCVQFETMPGEDPTQPVVWTWMRNDTVVAVGATRSSKRTGTVGAATTLGVDLGQWVDADSLRRAGWTTDADAPRLIGTRRVAGGEATIADVDGDRRADYVRLEAPEALPCDADSPDADVLASAGLDVVPAPTEGARIAGRTLDGVSLGDPASVLTPEAGWFEVHPGGFPCRVFPGPQGAAHVDDGVIVGLGAVGIDGGPAAGDRLTAAREQLGGTATRWQSVGGSSSASLTVERPGEPPVVLGVTQPPVLLDQLDRWYDIGEHVVTGVTLGTSCY